MDEKANLIQAVINTLQQVKIEATIENMETMLICHKMLAEIRDSMMEVKDGTADTE